MRSVTSSDDQIISVAQEIARYFAAHVKAADSPEGIARWWLARQRLQESTELVMQALEYLVQQGKVEKISSHSGKAIYKYVLQHKDEYH